MLETLKLKLGPSITSSPIELDLHPSVTVFIGPNNSGKSQALRDINSSFSENLSLNRTIVEEVIFSKKQGERLIKF